MSSNQNLPKVKPFSVLKLPNGAIMGARNRPIQERDGEELAVYNEGRNEPRPVDSRLVSNVKPEKGDPKVVVGIVTKSKAEGEKTMGTNFRMFDDKDEPSTAEKDDAASGIPHCLDEDMYRDMMKK